MYHFEITLHYTNVVERFSSIADFYRVLELIHFAHYTLGVNVAVEMWPVTTIGPAVP